MIKIETNKKDLASEKIFSNIMEFLSVDKLRGKILIINCNHNQDWMLKKALKK